MFQSVRPRQTCKKFVGPDADLRLQKLWKCRVPLEIRHFRRLQLQGQLVCDKGDEFGISRFSLGIAHRIAEKSLQSVKIPTIPGNFNGMANGSFHSGRGGLEGLRHLGVENLGDGIGVPYGPPGSLLDGVCGTSLNNKFFGCIYCFISCPYHCWFVGLIPMIAKSNF